MTSSLHCPEGHADARISDYALCSDLAQPRDDGVQRHVSCLSQGCVQVQVSIGDEELEQTLEARNTGDKPFELTAALHTYVAVSSIEKVRRPRPSSKTIWSCLANFCADP